jgi:sugar (pentulose or hexulose) kinase
MKSSSTSGDTVRAPNRLQQSVGRTISRLQDASVAFDGVAADILALDRNDLPCLTALVVDGRTESPASGITQLKSAWEHCSQARWHWSVE